jgi:salicylate hydroxylase
MQRKRPHILIAGGGLGGLTAALALLRKGFDVDVYEQAQALREVGAGVQLSANGNRVLFELGLEDALRACAVETQGKEVRMWSTGQTWKLHDLGAASVARWGFPYFTVYRPDLLDLLAAAVRAEKADAIHLNARVTTATQTKDRVQLTLEDGRVIEGDLLIGADGVHSKIRQTLFGADRPQFTGIIAWRGVIPMEKLPNNIGRMIGTNWVGPGGHIVHYPLRRGELMNFVGALERDDWQIESWTAAGTHDECLRDFKGWHADIQHMIASIPTPFKWALMNRAPLEHWSVGRISLLGDACHSTLPMLAQGAVQALEDGFILARAIAEISDPIEALVRYEKARLARTTRMVNGSNDNAKRFHNPALADPVTAAEYVTREWSEARINERYDWLFQYDALTVPI